MPTIQDLNIARQVYREREPRDLFYRAATELVELALGGVGSLNVAESVAVLLQTWNKAFYRYRPFDEEHFRQIEHLINKHEENLRQLRGRSIEDLGDQDREIVQAVFKAFEEVLDPVGAAKCLHLLAPRFLPLWDRAIAAGYGVPLGQIGTNAGNYWIFLKRIKEKFDALGGEQVIGENPLKAIDEYNYCRHRMGWI